MSRGVEVFPLWSIYSGFLQVRENWKKSGNF